MELSTDRPYDAHHTDDDANDDDDGECSNARKSCKKGDYINRKFNGYVVGFGWL